MKNLIYILCTVSFLIAVQSCKYTVDVEASLDKAASFMSDNPEQSLDILKSVCRDSLSTRRIRARYALLYSIALDKNCIDIASDSIIAPAVKYYRHHGTADDKLKANYYLGRIYQNAGKAEKAMQAYLSAEKYSDRAMDIKSVARLYSIKAYVYMNLLETEKALKDLNKASVYACESDDTALFVNLMLDKANCHASLNEKDSAKVILAGLHDTSYDRMSVIQKSRWYGIYASSCSMPEDEDLIKNLLCSYTREIPASYIYWINVAKLYLDVGMYGQASQALMQYERTNSYDDNPSYLYIKAKTKYYLQEYVAAASLYDRYINQYGKDDLDIIRDNTKYVEAKYYAEQQRIKDKYIKIILLLSIILIVVILAVIAYAVHKSYLSRLSEKKQAEARNVELEKQIREYSQSYQEVCAELDELQKVRMNTSLDKDVIRHIDERMNVLNKFIIAEISSNYSELASAELKRLMASRNDFLESTKWTLALSHTKFIDYLKQLDMTDWEIGCCCLYAIGLKGKDIYNYLNLSKDEFYKFSRKLRQKLNLSEYKCNIDKYLIELLRSLS